VAEKDVIIIGAGIGGITTSIYLAQKGYSVKIFEKNAFAGGRCSAMTIDGHRFDTGATLLMMHDVYERTYRSIDRKLDEELELYRMDPIYRIFFHDGRDLLFTSDLPKMRAQLEAYEPGSFEKFIQYMEVGLKAYRIGMKHIIDRNYSHFLQFFNFKNLLVLKKVQALKNHYRFTGKFFRHPFLRAAFTFQNIYVGQNPYKASAVFSMLPFIELSEGVWFPRGGMSQVTKNLLEIAKEEGVKIEYNSEVKEITTEGRRVTGIRLVDGTIFEADIVVNNSDLPYAYSHLIDDSRMKRKMKRMKYACSAIVFHWAMDQTFQQLEQHNVFVAKDLKNGLKAIFEGGKITDDFSFYIHSPAKSDDTAAPPDQDSISVIVPVANMKHNTIRNIDEMKIKIKNAIFSRLEKEGITGFESHIKFEKVFEQQSWLEVFNLYNGATFGSLSHNLLQMGYMRPHNQHRKFKNLFFVGGSTHPGNGAPMSLISARLTSEKIING
jgi:phytoene desaturase